MIKREKILIIFYILFSIFSFAIILLIPQTRVTFIELSSNIKTKYIMGFIKFALLATAGELISARLANKAWCVPKMIIARFIIWGIIGVWITFMMGTFTIAVNNGILPVGNNPIVAKILKAFYTSVIMNTSFGPTFMALHKCSDRFLELKSESSEKIGIKDVVGSIDWCRFVNFTILKTVPLFWIPAHTITFLLPGEYQVIMAASLSIALGIILNIKK